MSPALRRGIRDAALLAVGIAGGCNIGAAISQLPAANRTLAYACGYLHGQRAAVRRLGAELGEPIPLSAKSSVCADEAAAAKAHGFPDGGESP
jgi:hypothetical protein